MYKGWKKQDIFIGGDRLSALPLIIDASNYSLTGYLVKETDPLILFVLVISVEVIPTASHHLSPF